MKRMLILVVTISLLFSFMFMGCSEDKGAARLTDEEVSTIAMASLGSCMVPMMFTDPENPLSDGFYDADSLEVDIISGSLTVSNSGTTFAFTDCEIATGETETITLGGGFSIEVGESGMIITYNDFNLSGTAPGITTSINIIVTGTLTMTETEFSVDITISGITDNPCAVVIVLSMGVEGPEEITSATINGVDYTEEFTTALASF